MQENSDWLSTDIKNETGYNSTLSYVGNYYKETAVTVGYRTVGISSNKFLQNYAGSRGSAINLLNIQNSMTSISSSTFENNTGAYSIFEIEHKLPFYDILNMR